MPNPWLIVVALVGAIALSGSAYFKGRADGIGKVRAQWMEAELAAARGTIGEERGRADLSSAIGRAVGAAMAARDAQTRQLLQEVKDVVTAETDQRFPLPCGLVRLHDAGALGIELSAVTACAGQPDDAAAPVGASDLAAILAANYGSCHLTSDQVKGWQEFYEGLRARERQ